MKKKTIQNQSNNYVGVKDWGVLVNGKPLSLRHDIYFHHRKLGWGREYKRSLQLANAILAKEWKIFNRASAPDNFDADVYRFAYDFLIQRTGKTIKLTSADIRRWEREWEQVAA